MKKKQLIFAACIILLVWGFFVFLRVGPSHIIFNKFKKQQVYLGKTMLDGLLAEHPRIDNKDINWAIKVMKRRVMKSIKNPAFDDIKVIAVRGPQINAGALLGGHIVLFSGLLAEAESAEEVAAVLCHEIGHVQMQHVMKNLSATVAINVFGFMMGAGGDLGFSQTMSKSFFDRSQEAEADDFALDLMVKSNIDPASLAIFFKRLREKSKVVEALDRYLEFMNSHPNLESREKKSLDHEKPEKIKKLPINWKAVQRAAE